jgi:DNA-binding NarL/FixJ family response regulator
VAKVTVLCDDAVLYATLVTHWFKADPEIEIIGHVSTARDALERSPDLRPDVVVLDHMLPDGCPASGSRLRAACPGNVPSC